MGEGTAQAQVRSAEEMTSNDREIEVLKLQKELQLRTELSRVVTSYTKPQDLLPNILSILCSGFGANGGAIYFMEKETNEITLKATHGLDKAYAVKYQKIHLGSHVTGKVAETGEGMIIKDASVDRRSTKGVVDLLKYRSAVVTPVISEGEVVGIIALISEEPGFFTQKDLKLLDVIGAHVSLAIVNSFLNQAIQQERERTLAILERLDEGIFEVEIKDPLIHGTDMGELVGAFLQTGRFTLLNPSFSRQSGKGIQIGDPMLKGFDEVQLVKMLKEVLSTGEVVAVERKWVGEEERLYGVSLFRVDRNGLIRGVKGTRRDMTKRLRMEERLQESKSKTEFYLDLLSHDVANINTVVMGFLEVQENMGRGGGEMNAYIKTIKDEIKRSSQLLKKVRTLARVQREKPRLATTDVFKRIGPGLDTVKKQYSGKTMMLEFNQLESKIMVECDELIDDLFQNVFRMAADQTDGEKVVVGLEIKRFEFDERKGYLLRFSDRGRGIPDSMKQKIFTDKKIEDGAPPGPGLSLSVIKEVAERFGGKIWIEDRVKGDHSQGTSLMIFLPASSSQ